MGYIGVSLIIASVVWVIVAPPPWMHPFMPPFLLSWHFPKPPPGLPPPPRSKSPVGAEATNGTAPEEKSRPENRPQAPAPPPPTFNLEEPTTDSTPTTPGAPPVIAEPDEQTTPKARPANPPPSIPSFALEPTAPASNSMPPPPAPLPGRGSMPPPSPPSLGSMPPPPPPSSGRGSMPPPRGPIPPRLAAFPAANSPQRARPVPNRGPTNGGPSSSSSLAPPPTHSAKPSKPTRKVILTPGHSPLDWARISGPNADLRNLPPSTPYLKVTPSMLKKMTGRKGKDAWMALGGRVYNITPYLPYHPAGEPELLRGAGRDGTKLFGEVHPWVNYETMLSACLVGLLVDEEEGARPSEMDEMD
ncbi:Cytochrome b5 reductase 4 [Colletotrichum spinosum]|uniref:Cytochrome b5 reductase 4 n=1 Tax=Colletotrichum spinosum TaxID=1347390 RepID=A0A4R8QC81_9PEZI|nr:Cytochrome b5 reductase 4 [Colletotrichum spinosum]